LAQPKWKLCQIGANCLKKSPSRADASSVGLESVDSHAELREEEIDVSTVPTKCDALLEQIVVKDPGMLEVMEVARKVARHKAAVLITGETGVGKELVARIIHEHSNRCAKPLVDLNCAALPEHLVESELFGYEKGAFSGADSAKPGLFEIANGGTLFLDEIGELDPKVQVKLLRVLDGAPYYRLGGNRKVRVDVRVVAATNRDLEVSVRDGTFRRDLYHRINELHIKVPPLRERHQDIIALAEYFLERNCPDAKFTPEALELLPHFEWRGNVRELRNLILKLAILSSHHEITAEEVRLHLHDPAENEVHAAARPFPEISSIAAVERQMIVRALEMTRGNQSLAAEHLGMPRRTFCRKLNQYQITLGRRSSSATKAGARTPLSFRAELNVPVIMTTNTGLSFTADARNLSAGGLGLKNVCPPLQVSEECTISFTLPRSHFPIAVHGLVVWSQPDATAGIKFTDISDSTAELLRGWIANHRQLALTDAAAFPPLDEGQNFEAQASCV